MKQNCEIRYNPCFVCDSLGNYLCQITFETTGQQVHPYNFYTVYSNIGIK